MSSSSSSSENHLPMLVEIARLEIESFGPTSIEPKFAEYCRGIPDQRKVVFKNSRSAIVRIENAELCARIIGRSELNMIYVRAVTNSIIDTPRINAGRSDCCFNIEAFTWIDLITTIYIINLLADYFSIEMNQRLMTLQYLHNIRVERLGGG